MPSTLVRPAAHYHRYTTVGDDSFTHWRVDGVVARGEADLAEPLQKPAHWWWAVRRGSREGAGSDIAGESFGLRVQPVGVSRPLAATVKPMLDGVIAAFHHDEPPTEEAVRRLSAQLDVEPADVHGHLQANGSPLGHRTLVRAYRDGVQWNPADDLCVACAIENQDPSGRPLLRWELLRLSRVSDRRPSPSLDGI